jgi:hypothetical protein
MAIEKDNFLPTLVQKQILDILTHKTFTWNFRDKVDIEKFYTVKDIVYKDPNIILGYGFNHTFFNSEQKLLDYGQYPIDLLSIFKYHTELHYKVKINKIMRLMAVLSLPDPYRKKENYMLPHVDWFTKHKTLIYYANNTDGDTIIFNEKFDSKVQESLTYKQYYELEKNKDKKTIQSKISPKQGKAVLIDGLQYHSGSLPTNKTRYVINFNFC